jgi:hypothetical protein
MADVSLYGAESFARGSGGIDSIRSTRMADIEKATPYVKVSLNEVLAAEPVSNPVTRPYGCTIKY